MSKQRNDSNLDRETGGGTARQTGLRHSNRGLAVLALALGALLPSLAHAQFGLGVLPPIGVTYYEKIRVIVVGGTAGCIAEVTFSSLAGAILAPSSSVSVTAGQAAFVEFFGSYASTGRAEVLADVIPNDPTGRAITCVSSADVVDITTAPDLNVVQAHYNQDEPLDSSNTFSFGGMTLHPGDLKHLRLNAMAPTPSTCVVSLSFVDQNEITVASKSLSIPGGRGNYLELLGLALPGPDDFYRPVAKISSGFCLFSVEYWDPTTGKTLSNQAPILYGYVVP